MPTRFDHAMIVVRDLDTAIQCFQHLGFEVRPGGRHTIGGTHNALIRFGTVYVELLAVYDKARVQSFRGRTILDELHGRDASLVSYALTTTTIEQDATRFTGDRAELAIPYPMRRKHPNGHQLSWRTLAPGGNFLGRPWPFLIQWDTTEERLLQIDQPGTHPNGAINWVQINVATWNLDSAIDVYRNQLGLELIKLDISSSQVTQQATFRIGQSTIRLLSPASTRSVQQILAEKGEGPYSLAFAVKDLKQTCSFLEQKGIKFTHKPAGTGKLVLDPNETQGICSSFVG